MKHKKRAATNPLMPNDIEYCRVGDKIKRKYPTKLDAELFAPDKDLQQYICDYCGFWHNGNSSHNHHTQPRA